MGQTLRDLKIPVGFVLTSPAYRAMETVQLARFPNPRIQAELGDGGQSMQAVADGQSGWLKRQVAQLPSGTNTIIVTHLPNISAAFPQWSNGLSDGEVLIFGSDGKNGATMIARIKIEQWPTLPR